MAGRWGASLVLATIVLEAHFGAPAALAACATAPRAGCVAPTGGLVALKEATAGRERLKVALKGLAADVALADLGDPVTGATRYDLCLYDGAATLVGTLAVDRAGDTCGTSAKPCWKTVSDRGYRYRDAEASADGLQKMVVLGGFSGRGTISIKAGNSAGKQQTAMPTGIAPLLANAAAATVQVVASDGSCFGARMTRVLRADGASFSATAPEPFGTSTTLPVQTTTTAAASTTTVRPSTTTTTTTSGGSTTTTLANQPPRASAGPDQATQTLVTLGFSGAGSSDPDGTIVAYQWSFGDGVTAAGVTASHAYASAGTYTVTLAVTDNRGATRSDTATVSAANRSPVAAAGPDRSVSQGTAVAFSGAGSSDPDGAIVAHAWAFGDGTSATGAAPSHAYTVPGTYTVRLTVTDDRGATGSDTALVTVSPIGGSTWARRVGAGTSDGGYAVAVDGAGNVFAGGTIRGTVDLGGVTLTSAGGADWFVVKYSPAGAVLWARRMGGASDDLLADVAVDRASGDVVVTGRIAGTASLGGASLVVAGTSDVAIGRYAGATGAHQWSRRFGGAYDDDGDAVAVDGSGNVLLTGYFRGTVDFGTGPLTVPFDSDLDVFVAKLSGAGATLWAKHFTNNGNDQGRGLAVDGAGNVAITGMFSNTIDFGGGLLSSAGGMTDVFVVKLAANGAHVWSRRIGATDGSEGGNGIAFDPNGNVVFVGFATKPVDAGGGLLAALGGGDVVVAKYAGSSGAHVWSRRLGGAGNDYGYGVAADAAGAVTVAGSFDAPAAFGGATLTPLGGADAVVAKFGASGAPVWSRALGGTGADSGQDVAFTPSGSPVATGYFYGTGTFGGTPLASAGAADAFVASLAP